MKRNNLNKIFSNNGFKVALKEATICHSFYEGLIEDPQITLNKILNNINYKKIIDKHPILKSKTIVEVILEAPTYSKSIKVKKAKELVEEIIKTLRYNWTLNQNKLISEGFSIVEAQTNNLQKFLKLNNKESLEIKEVFTEGSIDLDHAKRITNSFIVASSLIPKKYHISNLELIISAKAERSLSLEKSNTIILNVQKQMVPQIGEGLHELAHLIELNNENIIKSTNKFLKSKRFSPLLISIKDYTKKYKKDFVNSDELIYETNLINYYSGKSYGVLDKELVPTEIFSVGLELLFTDPIEFYIKDPDYFNLIQKFLNS